MLSWDILTEISFQASLGFDRGSLLFQRLSAANVPVTEFTGLPAQAFSVHKFYSPCCIISISLE
jgi:hypothetical protein